jgi:hypothetical protein
MKHSPATTWLNLTFIPLTIRFVCMLVIFIASFTSCLKDPGNQTAPNNNEGETTQTDPGNLIDAFGGGPSTYCVEDAENGSLHDTIRIPTILGPQLLGQPYSVAVMQQAATNLYGASAAASISVNKWYIKLKPNSVAELVVLESYPDLELFDHPLDRKVLQQGDYYNDGVTPAGTIPWLYAMVDIGFSPPPNVQYQLIQAVHVPQNDALENEAFRITGNPYDGIMCETANQLTPTSVVPCPCNIPLEMVECINNVTTNCGGGTGTNTNTGIPNGTRIPWGRLTVTDDITNTNVPVRQARMIAKRFLKIERVYTNNDGVYIFTKSFANRVTLLAKFKNPDAEIHHLEGGQRLWRIVQAARFNLGRFRGNLSNINSNIDDNDNVFSRAARNWANATTHNGVQEFKALAAAQQIGSLPANLQIVVVSANGNGSAPMFSKRFAVTDGAFITGFLLGPLAGPPAAVVGALAAVTDQVYDVSIGYNGMGGRPHDNSHMAELVFHELTHVAHYNKVGNNWWANLVQAEVIEIIANVNTPQFSPYGNGTNPNTAPRIALAESWGAHMGHFLASLKYGDANSVFFNQGERYRLNDPVGGLNSNLNLLEDFDPNIPVNLSPFRWIPDGLYYDLMDDRNDINAVPRRVDLNDDVSSYTNSQFFLALNQNITTLPAFRTQLLNNNINSNQAVGVNRIFTFYGYF